MNKIVCKTHGVQKLVKVPRKARPMCAECAKQYLIKLNRKSK